MNPFEINICPLCGQTISCRTFEEGNIYECPTKVTLNSVPECESRSHYMVVNYNNDILDQEIYILPWLINNSNYHSKSRIYKSRRILGTNIDTFDFVMELPQLHMDNEENLLVRINRLVTFL